MKRASTKIARRRCGCSAARSSNSNRKKHTRIAPNQRRTLIGSGDRSERIRTYNFPQNRLTDHRIGLTLYKLDKIMQGELDDLISQMLEFDRNERLKGVGPQA